jgi:hypothetical protein
MRVDRALLSTRSSGWLSPIIPTEAFDRRTDSNLRLVVFALLLSGVGARFFDRRGSSAPAHKGQARSSDRRDRDSLGDRQLGACV